LWTFTFQTLQFFALFSIMSLRERRVFWASRPSVLLAAAIIADGILGVRIGIHGFAELRPLPLTSSALIFLYAGAWVLGPNSFVKPSLSAYCEKRQRGECSIDILNLRTRPFALRVAHRMFVGQDAATIGDSKKPR
jgi:hypothetical protein